MDWPIERAKSPESVGLSRQGLERITATITRDVKKGSIRGAVALIARDGKLAYLEARGMADWEGSRPIGADTIFRIYSMTKPLTSVAMLMLCEEEKVHLNDQVGRHLPQLAGRDVLIEELAADESGMDGLHSVSDGTHRPCDPTSQHTLELASREMTIEDLLRHTSGLCYGWFPRPQVDRFYREMHVLTRQQTLAEFVDKLGPLPLKHHPGTCWEYSVSSNVVARLIEVISGKPFDVYLNERLILPLEMHDTSFHVSGHKKERFAELYTRADDGNLEPHDFRESEGYLRGPVLFSGGSGLVSTALDYLRFCQMMLNGGELDGTRFLREETVQMMTRDHLGDNCRGASSRGYGFGLGFAVATDPERTDTSEGEYYWGGVAGTRFWIDPRQRLIGIYMVQILPHTGLTFGQDFKQQVYEALETR